MYAISGYAPTQPVGATLNVTTIMYSGPVFSSIETVFLRRSYRRLKRYCPPPPDWELVTLPLPETEPPERPRGVAWLARLARTPARERRPIRNRVERKDATWQ
jgi:hypothetical protein